MSIKDAIGIHQDNPLWEGVQKSMNNEIETNALYVKPQLRYLGLSSHIGGGKDYVASYLQKTLERKIEIVKFATKMTEVVGAILGIGDLSLFQDRSWKELKQFVWNKGTSGSYLVSARDVQKMIGTDIMRNLVDDDIWVNAFGKQYNDPDTLYIISDLRFQNEFDFVQANNGIVVFIENREAAQQQYIKESKDGMHRPHYSESLAWSLFYADIEPDYCLFNNDYSNPQPLQDLVTFIKSI